MSASNWLRRASGLYLPGFAGVSRFGLGCTCCGTPTCDILSTDFNMADGTTLPTGWPTTTGWNISSNKLKGPAAGQITSSVSAPSLNYTISVDVTGISTTGRYARIYLGNVYVQVRYFFGSTLLAIYKPKSGGGFLTCDEVNCGATTSGTLTGCVKDDGTICATFGAYSAGCHYGSLSGTSFGLGSGTTNETFDNFVALVVSADCEACGPCSGHNKCGQCDYAYYAADSANLDFTGTAASGCCSVDGMWAAVPAVTECSGSVAIPDPSPCIYTGFTIQWSVVGVSIGGFSGTKFKAELKSTGPTDFDVTSLSWSYSFLPGDEDCSGVKTLTLEGGGHQGTGCTGSVAGSTVDMELNI